MPPSDPLRLALIQHVVTTIRGINGASQYHYAVKANSVITDLTMSAPNWPVTELPLFLVEPTNQGSRLYMPAVRIKDSVQLLVTAFHNIDGTAPDRKTTANEYLIADLEVALTQDITRGGRAIDTRLGEPQPFMDMGSSGGCGVIVPLDIRVIRTYGNPVGDVS